jgi:hypothetical protein
MLRISDMTENPLAQMYLASKHPKENKALLSPEIPDHACQA